jgi:hypothetical protein
MSSLSEIVEWMNGSFGDLRLIEEFNCERQIYIQSKDVIGANLTAGAKAGESAEYRDASDGVLILKQGQNLLHQPFTPPVIRLAQVDPHDQNVVGHRFLGFLGAFFGSLHGPEPLTGPTDKNT